MIRHVCVRLRYCIAFTIVSSTRQIKHASSFGHGGMEKENKQASQPSFFICFGMMWRGARWLPTGGTNTDLWLARYSRRQMVGTLSQSQTIKSRCQHLMKHYLLPQHTKYHSGLSLGVFSSITWWGQAIQITHATSWHI